MKLAILLTVGCLVYLGAITLNAQASLHQESLVSCTTSTETPAKNPTEGS
jgi:hypothetical protein